MWPTGRFISRAQALEARKPIRQSTAPPQSNTLKPFSQLLVGDHETSTSVSQTRPGLLRKQVRARQFAFCQLLSHFLRFSQTLLRTFLNRGHTPFSLPWSFVSPAREHSKQLTAFHDTSRPPIPSLCALLTPDARRGISQTRQVLSSSLRQNVAAATRLET